MRTLKRLAHEIIENNEDLKNVVLIGILRRGATLADLLGSIIKEITGEELNIGYIDITPYRDDIHKDQMPSVIETEINFSIKDKTVVLIDDVIFHGRTVRAAMDALIDMGRPQKIRLCEMVDRGHRELPIRPDYVGKNVPTAMNESIEVMVEKIDGEYAVRLLK